MSLNLVIAGGGTGGRLFPGRALAGAVFSLPPGGARTPYPVDMPIARYTPNGSRARRPIRKPTQTSVMKQTPTATSPANPSSPPTTEKVSSVGRSRG